MMETKIVMDNTPLWPWPPCIGESGLAEAKLMGEWTDAAPGQKLVKLYREMYGTDISRRNEPKWLVTLALCYGARLIGARRVSQPLADKELKVYALARDLKKQALLDRPDIREVLKYMVARGQGEVIQPKKVKPMSEKTKAALKKYVEDRKAKAAVLKKPRGPSAAKILVGLFRKGGLDDAGYIKAVVKAGSRCSVNSLAWYKAQFRQGKLKGQAGKAETIKEA